MEYKQLYNLDKVKVENSICLKCGGNLLSGSWDNPFLSDSTLDMFCKKCNTQYRLVDSIICGRTAFQVEENK